MIIPLKNHEYELLRLPRVAIVYILLNQYPILRNAETEKQTKFQMLDIDSFLRELSSCEGNIMTGVFRDNRVVSEHVYYWKGREIHRYDLGSQMEKKVTAPQVRKELLKLLQIEWKVEGYAR